MSSTLDIGGLREQILANAIVVFQTDINRIYLKDGAVSKPLSEAFNINVASEGPGYRAELRSMYTAGSPAKPLVFRGAEEDTVENALFSLLHYTTRMVNKKRINEGIDVTGCFDDRLDTRGATMENHPVRRVTAMEQEALNGLMTLQ